jgi:cephalosporin-C deacetylase-like acetyl esterase
MNRIVGILLLLVAPTILAEDAAAFSKIVVKDAWLQTPKTFSVPAELEKPGVKAVFYEGAAYQNKPTRVFAYYGIPQTEAGKKVPAMVLIHGGGGTAFESWVELWNKRGYAAIAMDTCGAIPKGKKPNSRFSNDWERHEHSGPRGWGDFAGIDNPPTDQWTYHAVSAAIIGHSLLRSFPEVDVERIGVTGVSWGGYLTCIVSGLDTRFKFAAPVYGCGFLGENSTWLKNFQQMGDEKSARWLKWWDPSVYLKDTAIPMLWVTGTNDFAYPPDSLQKSYRLPKSARTLCIKVRMPHGHGGAGENPPEILTYADSFFKAGKPLAKVTEQGIKGRTAYIGFKSDVPIVKAELNYTTASGRWQERKWETVPAVLGADGAVSAAIPEETKVYYFNLIDERGMYVSSEHVEK